MKGFITLPTTVAFVCGLIFGLGLSISGMVNPARVIGFLDVAGDWDMTLLLVMGGALAVTAVSFPLITRRSKPVLEQEFVLPTKTRIDKPLISGAILFGVGWGLAGLCPGPALTGLASLSPSLFLFVAAMVAGQLLATSLERS
ncbi:MAG: DUF6691 family protein [Pseudomonadales bacterium]|nr:DUF6691 family protein [Pseudomonadales bacterium]